MKFLISKVNILKFCQSGQSLIEVLIIVVLITAVISGSLGFLVQSYVITQLVAEQTTATYLSIEGIELVKNLIDANYCNKNNWDKEIDNGEYKADWQSSKLESSSSGNSDLTLWYDPSSGRYSHKDISGQSSYGPYKRTIKIEKTSHSSGVTDEIKVSSLVEWQSRRGNLKINLEDHFYDWRISEVDCL